jgi:hypothetical protein
MSLGDPSGAGLSFHRSIRFDVDEAQAASDEWGFNCGPGALCAVLNLTPDEIRPHLADFERKGYTNPKLMADTLRRLKVPFYREFEQLGAVNRDALTTPVYPKYGLIRIQWDGPWCNSGVPIRARYRHTHWIGMRERFSREAFDINAICVGGWILWSEWVYDLQPWLQARVEPKANGNWWPTHCWKVDCNREDLPWA